MFVATVALGACGAEAGTPATEPIPSATLSPVGTAAPTPRPSTSPFRVVAIDLEADPSEHVGACPVVITFRGHITADGGPGTVSYRWVSSDGERSPVQTLEFTRSEALAVSSHWTVDRSTVPTHAGWSSIEVSDPMPSGAAAAAPSPRAQYAFTCDGDDDVQAIGFELGGSDTDCSIAKPARTFAPDDPIRMVADWHPPLPAGTVVTARLTREGALVSGYPLNISFDVATKCVHGQVSPGHLSSGRYVLDLVPNTARAVRGEFDVR